jgi:putative ABC transport system permease protein
VSQFLGKTRSFLDFSANINLPTAITRTALLFGFGIAVIGVFAQLVPSFSAARHTIITYKQERARTLRAPWWQRAWLDLMLFVPAAYGAYLLRTQGSGALADPFQNPLLLLVPALGIFALTLFLLRILPLFMAAFAWIASRTKSVGILLAARHLSRMPGLYSAPLILLVLTLSLSTFTATLAQTLDRHLHDQSFYKVGADMSIVESGESTQAPGLVMGQAAETETDSEEPLWYFLPVSEHLTVPGVQAAARVALTPGSAIIGSNYVNIRMMGIDRVDFSQVAFWRQDFAQVPLGALMNTLALTTEGVLVPRGFLEQYNMKPGDAFRISLNQFREAEPFEVKVVGVFELWPTWYPSDGPMIIGNLDHLFERAGTEFPYNVWLKVKKDADYDILIAGVRDLFRHVFDWSISTNLVTTEQELPQRQGLFGLLSVGFIALAMLTVLGFLLYALFSFRRRFVELGMLRAVGLSSMQMILFLASELAFVLLTGLAAGTGLGVAVSNLFIPYLQVGGEKAARIPPYLVAIDWGSVFQIYILFGILFVVALAVLAALLLRMKIFQAVKLGESV